MEEKYLYKGKEFTRAALEEKYGENTDKAIAKFGFELVERVKKPATLDKDFRIITEEKYLYKGKEFTRAVLEEKYGENTDKAIAKFGFELVGKTGNNPTKTAEKDSVKKKDQPQNLSSVWPSSSGDTAFFSGSNEPEKPPVSAGVQELLKGAELNERFEKNAGVEKPNRIPSNFGNRLENLSDNNSAANQHRNYLAAKGKRPLEEEPRTKEVDPTAFTPEVWQRKSELEEQIRNNPYGTLAQQRELEELKQYARDKVSGKLDRSAYSLYQEDLSKASQKHDEIFNKTFDRAHRTGQDPAELLKRDFSYQEAKNQIAIARKNLEPYQQILQKLTEDSNSKMGLSQFFKNIGTTFGIKETPSQTIVLEALTTEKLMQAFDKLPNREKDKIYKGRMSLQEKEQLIQTAKVRAIESYSLDLSDKAKQIINNPDLSTTEKQEKLKEVEAEQYTFLGRVGYDMASGLLEDAFNKTTKAKKFNELARNTAIGKFLDPVSTALNGVTQVVFKGSVGFVGDVMAGIGDLFTDQESYSVFDDFSDTLGRVTGFDYLPVSDDLRGRIVDENGNYNITPYSIFKTFGEQLPFTAYLISETRKGNLSNVERMFGQMLNPKKSEELSQKIKLVSSAYRATFSDNLKEANAMDLHGVKALTFAGSTSFAEGFFSLIMPDYKYVQSTLGAGIKKGFVGNLQRATNRKAIEQASYEYIKNIGKELSEEELVALSRDLTKYGLVTGNFNSEFFDFQNQKQLVAGVVILSGVLGLGKFAGDFEANKRAIYGEISKNINQVESYIEELLKNENLSQADKTALEEAKKFAVSMDYAVNNSPKNVTAAQLELLSEKKRLQEEMEGEDGAFHFDYKERIADIDKKIQQEFTDFKTKLKRGQVDEKQSPSNEDGGVIVERENEKELSSVWIRAREKIRSLLDFRRNNPNEYEWEDIAAVSKEEAQKLRESTGLDITENYGYTKIFVD